MSLDEDHCEVCNKHIPSPELCDCNDYTVRCEAHELLSNNGKSICEFCYNFETDEKGEFIRG